MPKAPPGWFPRRGEVYLIQLDKARPAMILSSDSLNRHALDVCVVPITSVHHGRFALRIAIQPGDGGLNRQSWAKCDRVTTLDKQLLMHPALGRLSTTTIHRIEESVRLALDLI